MDEKKVREAIQYFRKMLFDMEEMGFKYTPKYYTTAIEALEKQLPKKPTYEGDGYASDGTFIWDEWLCPNCDSRYEVDYDDYGYCPNCGQRIDWEEEENERT